MGAVGDVVSSIVDGAKSVVSAIAAPVAAIPVLGPLVTTAATAAVNVLGGPLVTGAELIQRAAADPLGTAISAIPALVSGLTAAPDPGLVGLDLTLPGAITTDPSIGATIPMNGMMDPTLLDTTPLDPTLSVFGGQTTDPTTGLDLSQVDTSFNVANDVIGSNAGGFPDISHLVSSAAGFLTPSGAAGGGGAMPVATRLFPKPIVPMLPSIVGKGIMDTAGKFTKFGKMILAFMKRFGLGAGFSLGLTAAEIANLLMHASKRKKRRMNSCNPRALARATRRLCSFERRASRISSALGAIAGRAHHRRRQRCTKCHRSPCVC